MLLIIILITYSSLRACVCPGLVIIIMIFVACLTNYGLINAWINACDCPAQTSACYTHTRALIFNQSAIKINKPAAKNIPERPPTHA
jgi:hypothetical protein